MLIVIDEKTGRCSPGAAGRRPRQDEAAPRAAIDEAMTIRAEGGDPKTLWDKVSGVSETILNVQEEALLALGALADKVEGKNKTGELKRALMEIEHAGRSTRRPRALLRAPG